MGWFFVELTGCVIILIMVEELRLIEPRFFTRPAAVRGVDSLLVPLDITDPAQPNPSYRHDPGTHGMKNLEASMAAADQKRLDAKTRLHPPNPLMSQS